MKKNILVTFLICVFTYLTIDAQSTQIENLKLELRKVKEGEEKVLLFQKIATEYQNNDFTQSLKYANLSLKLSKKINDKNGYGTALKIIGVLYTNNGDYSKALQYYKQAQTIFESIKIKDGLSKIADCIANIALIHYNQGEYQLSTKEFLKAIKYYSKDGNKVGSAIVLDNLGNIFYRTKNYSNAIIKYSEGLKLFKEMKHDLGIGDCLSGIAIAYSDQGKYHQSLKYNIEALKIFKRIDDKRHLSEIYISIGVIKEKLGENTAAISYYKEALKLVESTQNYIDEAIANTNIAQIYLKQHKTKEAIEILNKALKEAKKINYKELISCIYLNLSDCYNQENNLKKALDFYKLHVTYNDSLLNEESSNQINELTIKFETEKKEKEIILLHSDLLAKKKDKALLQAKIQKRNGIIFGTLLGAILVIVTTILLFNRRRLIQQNKYQLALNQQRENTTAEIVQAQEKEQARIAKELHDSVGTFLSTLKINLQLYEDVIPPNKKEGYQNATNIIDKISVELRNIMKNLSNETLQDQGLIKGFEELVYRINELEIVHVDFHTTGLTERLNEITEHNLYRIAQELLNNCIKHAKAEHATLQLIEDEEMISLVFEDNGVGFDVDNPILKHKNHGMGLKNIYNRVNFIKGTIRVESSPKNGTIFMIEVPKKLA